MLVAAATTTAATATAHRRMRPATRWLSKDLLRSAVLLVLVLHKIWPAAAATTTTPRIHPARRRGTVRSTVGDRAERATVLRRSSTRVSRIHVGTAWVSHRLLLLGWWAAVSSGVHSAAATAAAAGGATFGTSAVTSVVRWWPSVASQWPARLILLWWIIPRAATTRVAIRRRATTRRWRRRLLRWGVSRVHVAPRRPSRSPAKTALGIVAIGRTARTWATKAVCGGRPAGQAMG
mmetsp:Transcript_15901/g.41085  ORF Transcript_15901/g.41085 Transcript_15901/m.41085 type:complete len:235 (+) Transcript_15901:215-919(+)